MCPEQNNKILYLYYTDPQSWVILKPLAKIRFIKEIRYTPISTQGIKDHWDHPWPILSVSSPNNRSIDKYYPGPEDRNI